MRGKKGIEMSFAWIFAIIVGAVILFIAVYFAATLIETEEHEATTKTAQEIANILDPMLTSVEQGRTDSISLIKETKIFTNCNQVGEFGENRIQISEKTDLRGKQWTDKGGDVATKNQYVFAENMIQGKKIYFFVLSFNMPFKVADIMIMHTKPYCFIQPPNKVQEVVESLSFGGNINITDRMSDCEEGSVKVCFSGGAGCDAVVYENYVMKGDKRLAFVDNLVYAAIFSSAENYECNVKRLMTRMEKLSQIYSEKASFVSAQGCGTGLQEDMNILKQAVESYNDLDDLIAIKTLADEIDRKNRRTICQLY